MPDKVAKLNAKECEILLRVTSDAMRNVESAALTEEQQKDWLQIATRSLQSATRKFIEAEQAGFQATPLAALRGRLREQASRLEAQYGIVVDPEGRVVRRSEG
jgi:hypothetical protein